MAFRQNPVPLVSDSERDHTSLPDAYFITGDGPPQWLDIVVFGEFRKTGMMDAVIQVRPSFHGQQLIRLSMRTECQKGHSEYVVMHAS